MSNNNEVEMTQIGTPTLPGRTEVRDELPPKLQKLVHDASDKLFEELQKKYDGKVTGQRLVDYVVERHQEFVPLEILRSLPTDDKGEKKVREYIEKLVGSERAGKDLSIEDFESFFERQALNSRRLLRKNPRATGSARRPNEEPKVHDVVINKVIKTVVVEGKRWANRTTLKMFGILQQVILFILIAIFVQREKDILLIGTIALEFFLVVNLCLQVSAVIYYYIEKDKPEFVWLRVLGRHEKSLEPKIRHYERMIAFYKKSLCIIVLQHIFSHVALDRFPKVFDSIRTVNKVSVVVAIMLCVMGNEPVLAILLGLDGLILLLPTSFTVFQIILQLVGLAISVYYYFFYKNKRVDLGKIKRTKTAVLCHYFVILLLRLQMLGRNADRLSFTMDLFKTIIMALVPALLLHYLVAVKKMQKFVMYFIISMLVASVGYMAFRNRDTVKLKLKEWIRSDDAAVISKLELRWEDFNEECGVQGQQELSVARVQLDCDSDYGGFNVDWSGKLVKLDYYRSSNDPMKMLPNPFRTWAQNALLFMVGRTDSITFRLYFDMNEDGVSDVVATASESFQECFWKFGCVKNGDYLRYKGKLGDMEDGMAKVKIYEIVGWELPPSGTWSQHLVSLSPLPSFHPLNSALFKHRSPKKACEELIKSSKRQEANI